MKTIRTTMLAVASAALAATLAACPLAAVAQQPDESSAAIAASSAQVHSAADYSSLLADLIHDRNEKEIPYQAAKAAWERAKASVDAAQASYDKAMASFAGLEGETAAAKEKADAAQAKRDEAKAKLDAAQKSLEDKTKALEDAQALYEKLANDDVVATAKSAYDAAKASLSEAKAVFDEAQAQVDADKAFGIPTKNTEAWTALGLFKWIRDNAQADSPEYWDAQCAIDILTGGTNTTGHDYGAYQGPVPDGENASSWATIANKMDLTDRGDAVALDSFKASLDGIDKLNATRQRENESEGTTLSTNIGMNCRQMAISIVQCDASRDYSVGHTQAYAGLENLHWGAGYDPYKGWYDEEKANFKANNGGVTGHYRTIVDQNSGTYAVLAGFAQTTSKATYGSCSELSLFVKFRDYPNHYPTPALSYTTQEFRAKYFDEYYQLQIDAGMNGIPEDVKKAHEKALADATEKLQALTDARDTAKATYEAEQQKMQTEIAKVSAALEQAKGDAQSAKAEVEALTEGMPSLETAATDAKATYDELQQKLEAAQVSANATGLAKALDQAQKTLDAEKGTLDQRQKAYDIANAALSEASSLESGLVIDCATPQTFTGTPVEPNVSVEKTYDGLTYALAEGWHYTLAYSCNNAAGTGVVTLTGLGEEGSGQTWGISKRTFEIVKPAPATLKPNPLAVTGKTVKAKAKALKKKAQKVSPAKAFSVSGAQTPLTYKKVKANKLDKKFKVASNGTITLKKGLKKGTYKLTIQANASKSAVYAAASKTFTVTVKVKK